MRVWLISDTHTRHNELIIPDGIDLVIHCGDEASSRNVGINCNESIEFFEWFESLPITNKIFVPGNHSIAVERKLVDPSKYCTYLNHSSVTINGVKIFGSPYTPSFGKSWAFMRNRAKMHDVWETVTETDVLITHGPPKGILDITKCMETNQLIQVGCASLRKHLSRIAPRIHAFGHIHSEKNVDNFGVFQNEEMQYVNASCINNHKQSMNNGVIINL